MHDSDLPSAGSVGATQGTDSAHAPDIDVVIAVHTTTRPLLRAINSCAQHDGLKVRVSVVCHNVSAADVKGALGGHVGDTVRFLELFDGIPSPAGPKNLGLEAATAPLVSVLDSDDFLEPEALGEWHARMVRDNSDMVLAPVRHEGAGILKTPRSRPWKESKLDPVIDGLAYATALRGLWKKQLPGGAEFRYTSGLRVGEDLAGGLELYFSGAQLSYPRRGPAYVLGNQAEDRVTGSLLPLKEEFRAVLELPREWLDDLTGRARTSIAVKIARTTLVGALVRRGERHDWTSEEITAVTELAVFLVDMAPGFDRLLTVRDTNLIHALKQGPTSGPQLEKAIQAYHRAGMLSRIFTNGMTNNFSSDAHLRQMVRAGLDRRR